MAAIALQRRVNSARAIRNPSVVQLFSSSSSTSNPNVKDQNQNTTQSPSQSSFSSYFSDVKASLKQQSSQQQQRQPLRRPFSTPLSAEKPPSKISSLQEIRKNLYEFHRGATVPPPAGDKSSLLSRPYLSFEEVYKRNVISKGGEEPSNKLNNGGKPSIQAIGERIKQLQSKSKNQTNNGGAMSLSKFTESFKLRPLDPNQKESPTVIGGGKYNLPASVFGKEMNKSVESSSNAKKKKRELFMKKYSSKEELGSKLRRLRPERDNNNNKWFSLGELNNRLMKLNEIEQKESESRNLVNFPAFKEIVQSLREIEMCEEEKANKSIIQRLEMLSQIGRTPNFMLAPPKENLVEKYFHPDNMSSSEKMKLELQKVRDEFKMSESDCGSSRVQVALLTTKIKHLSTTLHKKDKHSRKGLQAMVQKRKKLLKYLRRTDWDSYCLVLSKLGLRDNPDYKN